MKRAIWHVYPNKHDVLVCGVDWNSQETLNMLANWADLIIVMKFDFLKFFPESVNHKIKLHDVGNDIWGDALHPTLLNGLIADVQKDDWKRILE